MAVGDFDAAKAAEIVKKHVTSLHGNLASYTFKLSSVRQNEKKDIWYVNCEFFATVGDKTPNKYEFKVNVSTGNIEEIKSL